MKISSQGKKILIFSDVHQDIDKLTKIIYHEAADINICLGDWFDSFYFDLDINYVSTAVELKETFLSKPNNITLFGNHDLHYLFDNKYTLCSGYSPDNHRLINEALGKAKTDVVNKFNWFLFVDDYLCTHAGLHKSFIPSVLGNEGIYDYLTIQSNDADIKIRTNQPHWFYQAGYVRGGSQKKGGIVWLDFDQEFFPIENVSQIVGHTFRKKAKIQAYGKTDNYCIDTNLNEYLIIQNGKFEVKTFNKIES